VRKYLENVRRTGEMYLARSVVSYGLDGLGDRSRWWRDIPQPSRPLVGPNQPVKWVTCLFPYRVIGQGVTLPKHPHLAPRLKNKGKALPLQAWSGPEGSRKLRFPDYMTRAQDGGKVVSPTHRPPLPPRKYSWYSFLLEAESTSGP